MTAQMLLPSDSKAILDEVYDMGRAYDLFFDMANASVIRVGSDHGADFYVLTGIVEANRPFDVFVGYLEAADNVRLTFLQVPDDGDEPLARSPIEWVRT